MSETYLDLAERWMTWHPDILREASDHWLASGEWLTAMQLGRSALRQGATSDVFTDIRALPPPVGRISHPDDSLILRVRALAALPRCKPALDGFIEALRLAGRRLLAEEEHPVLRSSDLLGAISLALPVAERVSQLLLGEDWMFGGGSGSPNGEWERATDERTLPVLNVRSLTDYLRVEGERFWARPASQELHAAHPLVELAYGAQTPLAAPIVPAEPASAATPLPEALAVRVSARTRRRFHDMCASDGTVRRIAEVFEAEGVMPLENYNGPESGARRREAAAHEASLDLESNVDNLRLLRVYIEAAAEFGHFQDELTPPAKTLIQSLLDDGAALDADGRLLAPRPEPSAANLDLSDHVRLARPQVLRAHLNRINASTQSDPAATIAACKELLESACKFVLEDYGEPYSAKDDLLGLYKKAADALKLSAEAVPGSAKGSQTAQRALRSMATIVQALAEMRNELGLGHGRTKPSPALARHARLTSALTTGVVQFLLDTWHVRRDDKGASGDGGSAVAGGSGGSSLSHLP